MKGLIFDVQRFSVHDGPGIRTTVFMKGCPLRCRWCHNPEGLSGVKQLQFFEEKCLGCGECGDRSRLSDADRCPANALTVCGREIEEADLVKEVLKDRIFYGDTGGVTFSGGECLLQADFVAAVLRQLHALGLHTAVDTCGCVHWSAIEKTLNDCDLYLYDVKCVTSAVHQAYTGVGNELILENLQKLAETGKAIWIRTPVIPGFNNSPEEMSAIADCIARLPAVKQVTLMPYHTLGVSKYPTLGLSCPYDSTQKITEQEMAAFQSIFHQRNIPIV